MKSSVICIGDEILIGQIADTNSRFIAQRLNSLGIECSSIKIVADDKKALVELINEVLTNYIHDIKNDQTKNRSILDELDEVKNRISVLENLKK